MFTYQNLSPSSRKTGMTFIAAALARHNMRVGVVTVQLSWLSRLAGVERLRTVPRREINRWTRRAPNLFSYVWMPPLHPAGSKGWKGRIVGPTLVSLYPWLLTPSIIQEAKTADLIIIESSVAVALFRRLKRIAPNAKFVYCASDRLEVIGVQPRLIDCLAETATEYDLVRIPAAAMAGDFPEGTRVAFIPHGLEKKLFDEAEFSPYNPGTTNAVIAGDMNSDAQTVHRLATEFPTVNFHVFGRMDEKYFSGQDNVKFHGEVGFPVLVPYIKFADVGIAPYDSRPRAEYLAQSSLKLLQYAYAKLPIVGPEFIKAGREHIFVYDRNSHDSIRDAMQHALYFDRSQFTDEYIKSWDETVQYMAGLVGLDF